MYIKAKQECDFESDFQKGLHICLNIWTEKFELG